MSGYQREQREPVKWVQIGAIWNGDMRGVWCGKGSVSKDIAVWKAKLLLLPETKIDVFPVENKTNERAPDFTVCLRVPESLLPQEYWDEMDEREAQRTDRGGRGRGGYDRAPSRRPARDDYDDQPPSRPSRPAPRSQDPYPPRRESPTRPPASSPRRTPEVQEETEELVDVFEEENYREQRRAASAAPVRRGRQVPQADDPGDDQTW